MTPTFIMAVPWELERMKNAAKLRKAVDGEVVWDETKNAFDTFRRVLKALGSEAGIILEDDVILTDNWREKVEAALEGHRGEIVQFFSLRNETESHYEPGRTFLMNQCYYLPAGYAEQLLAFTDTWVEDNPEHPTGYDIAMAKWMQGNKLKYWMHVPSLVQHQAWTSEINSQRPKGRQSKVFDG